MTEDQTEAIAELKTQSVAATHNARLVEQAILKPKQS